MSQEWSLCCIDRSESSEWYADVEELIYDNKKWIEGYLMAPVVLNLDPLPIKPLDIIKTKRLSLIEQLPNDILFRIFAATLSLKDKVSFCLTCYSLAHLGQKFFQLKAKYTWAAWCNARLICVGSEAGGEYPKGIFNQLELAKMEKDDPFCMRYIIEKEHVYVEDPHMFCTRQSCTYNCRRLIKALFGYNNTVFPSNGNLILRNKTLRVYIRKNRIKELSKSSFTAVLIPQVAWSQDPSGFFLDGHNYDAAKGPWAGHRFDIADIDQIDDSWADVSDEVIVRSLTLLGIPFTDPGTV